ncbi:MAG: winged helix-turn-helix domain-containing protein, partial [Acidobacteriota bacterium]
MPGPHPQGPRERERYRFGLYELDSGAAELRRDGRKVPLQDLPLRLLETLVGRPGELVGRDELRTTLWPPDVHVDFDGSLNAAVRRLREALGDSAKDPRFLETVPRRGYRFIAPVARVAPDPAPAAATTEPAPLAQEMTQIAEPAAVSTAPVTPTPRRWLAWLPAAAVALGVVVVLALRMAAPSERRT